MEGAVKIDIFSVSKKCRRAAADPNRSPAQYPQGAGRIRKAAKPPTAALRVAVGSEEQQNERAMSFAMK